MKTSHPRRYPVTRASRVASPVPWLLACRHAAGDGRAGRGAGAAAGAAARACSSGSSRFRRPRGRTARTPRRPGATTTGRQRTRHSSVGLAEGADQPTPPVVLADRHRSRPRKPGSPAGNCEQEVGTHGHPRSEQAARDHVEPWHPAGQMPCLEFLLDPTQPEDLRHTHEAAHEPYGQRHPAKSRIDDHLRLDQVNVATARPHIALAGDEDVLEPLDVGAVREGEDVVIATAKHVDRGAVRLA